MDEPITFLDFIRKVHEEKKARGFILKGGPGSGWYAPPKGTHTEDAKAGPKAVYTLGGKQVKERQLLRRVVSTQKELIGYERGRKLPIKPKHRLNRATDVLARARYAYLDDPKRREKLERAARVIEVFDEHGAGRIAFTGITGITD